MKNRLFYKHFFLFLFVLLSLRSRFLFAQNHPPLTDPIHKENSEIYDRSQQIKQFYELAPHQEIKEITQDLINSPLVSQANKTRLIKQERRVFLFQYPSDQLKVKGFISFTPRSIGQPTLLLLRGGNREFGLLDPSHRVASFADYITISSTLRGGVSEGEDQFGGEDVNDIKNLVDFIPQLQQELGINFHSPHLYMLGVSRGGMEMFLALARYPELQSKITKAVSLSGVLDLRDQLKERSDMREMFEKSFGLNEHNQAEWVEHRNPIANISTINTTLPLLIIQGTQDKRVTLTEGHEMVKALEATDHKVTYWEIENGDHTLSNHPELMESISAWLEN